MTAATPAGSWVGERITIRVGDLVHGGHCVARHEGRVVFVRHALPGEEVVAQVTEGDDASRFLRADAVEVLSAAPGRVAPRCPVSGPGGCGGCDFQHVGTAEQRRLLGGVVAEQLRRIAHVDVDVEVEAVAGDDDGLGWRTRVRYAVDAQGALGLRRHRSHEVVAVDACPLAHPASPAVAGARWPEATAVETVVSGTDEQVLVVHPAARWAPLGEDVARRVEAEGVVSTQGQVLKGSGHVTEQAAGRRWRVAATGFWQVHPGAPRALTEAVLTMLAPRAGEQALDLYCGVGLFTASLAERVGTEGRVVAVEGDREAVRDARHNLSDLPQARVVRGSVAGRMRTLSPPEVDLVVLDPPRTGARREVVEQVVARRPRAVCYVACDPAALARDVAVFAEHGYDLTGLRGFDIFPMTHHVECVALLTPRNGMAARGVGRA